MGGALVRLRRRWMAALLTAVAASAFGPSMAMACSPPFNPTIEALGPAQVVVVGRIGERVETGRLFHVERWFNGGQPTSPIVIAFKEGEPVGDCSYPVSTGQRLIIAPYVENGRLHADLATLQADPASEQGAQYVAEATRLFGPGVVPQVVEPIADPADPGAMTWLQPAVLAALGLIALVLFGTVSVAARRR